MATAALKTAISKTYEVLKARLILKSSSSDKLSPSSDTNNLKSLTDSINTLNADNVNLHELMSRVPKPQHHPNAVTFIEICHNQVFTAVIIVLRSGHGIPLHDHPKMTGIIKVLHGQVVIRSYTPLEEPIQNGKVSAIRLPDTVLSRVSYPQVLTPTSQNIHQIDYFSGESGKEEYAAFLDILSPPYQDGIGCHYYKPEESHNSKAHANVTTPQKCNLVEVDCPKDYRTISVALQL